MANRKFMVGILVLIVIFVTLVVGCDDLFTNEFDFKNESSYPVNVTPSGYNSFTLETGKSKSIKTKDNELPFLYAPANLVNTKLNNTKITFVNR